MHIAQIFSVVIATASMVAATPVPSMSTMNAGKNSIDRTEAIRMRSNNYSGLGTVKVREDIEARSKPVAKPEWITVKPEDLKIKPPPPRKEMGISVQESLITELYNRKKPQ